MKSLDQFINEKLMLNEDTKMGKTPTYKIDIDSESDAKEVLKGIKEVYGKTGITVKDGKHENVIFSCKTLDDFLKVCGLISVAWNPEGTDSIMPYNGDEDDYGDLAYCVSGYDNEIKANIKQIENYANLWIKWFENNDFEYR